MVHKMQVIINIFYIVAAIFFIFGIKMLGSASTARRGNQISAIGMLIAVLVTLVEGTLMVADRGPGIAAHDLPHVFERFYRSAESRGMPGSGLGLSIVRDVVSRAGGTVSAASRPNGGAAIGFTLPVSPSWPAPPGLADNDG